MDDGGRRAGEREGRGGEKKKFYVRELGWATNIWVGRKQ